MTNEKNVEEINLLEPNQGKSKVFSMTRVDSKGNNDIIKISKKNIDDTLIKEVDNLQLATNSISTVINILEKQITSLNEKFEKEKQRTRRKEWINRGRNRKGKYY